MTIEVLKYNMKDYPAEMRPRERMDLLGAQGLSDRELLAILLSTGTKEYNALQLADLLLAQCHGLRGLVRLSMEDLTGLKGIGIGKATRIVAAVELGKRIGMLGAEFRPKITGSQDAANLLMEDMCRLEQEVFKVILLNTKNMVLSIETVSIGILNSALVHPREVYKHGIKRNANGIILAHNHPSGDCTPSQEDRLITTRLIDAGLIIGIPVLDHIIIGQGQYYSFKEQGIL